MTNPKRQSGQTLIETVVAVFILVMGITAAVGLAIYALRSSQDSTNQIVGMGLAREGLEAVKWMRDTNWLLLGSPDTNCYNYIGGKKDGICFQKWLQPPGSPSGQLGKGYDLSAGGTALYAVTFGLSGNKGDAGFPYFLTGSPSGYAADFNSADSGNGLYSFNGNSAGSSRFYRQIEITQDSTPPYDQADVGPRLLVKSRVWWWGKTCGNAKPAWPGKGSCAIELQTYLTNWKNY